MNKLLGALVALATAIATIGVAPTPVSAAPGGRCEAPIDYFCVWYQPDQDDLLFCELYIETGGDQDGCYNWPY